MGSGDSIHHAAALFNAGKLAEAERVCLGILKRRAADGNALHLLGVLKARRGAWAEALSYFDRALRVEPRSYELLLNRGMTLQAMSNYDGAIESYDRALAVKPDCVQSLARRGDALAARARLDDAVASYDR